VSACVGAQGALVGDSYALPSSNASQALLATALSSVGVTLPQFSTTGGTQWSFLGRRGASRGSQRYAGCGIFLQPTVWRVPKFRSCTCLWSRLGTGRVGAPSYGGAVVKSNLRCYAQTLLLPENVRLSLRRAGRNGPASTLPFTVLCLMACALL
jgi:hypothetical protein